MFLSMTGYGTSTREFEWGTVFFELSSVNHKYQDFVTKVPPELANLETRFLNTMRQNLGRGHIRLYVEIKFNAAYTMPLIDENGLMNFYDQLKKISRKHNLTLNADMNSILAIPGILNSENNSAAKSIAGCKVEVWDEILNEAINSLNDMRKTEGAKLQSLIENDLKVLQHISTGLKNRWQVSKDDALENLRVRIQSVMQHYDLEIDEARIAQEVALMGDRWDVSEELSRFEDHIEKFKSIIANEQTSPGKKLDFLIQELNREANTMGAKVNDAPFRWAVVEAKAVIEKIREQLQNVE